MKYILQVLVCLTLGITFITRCIASGEPNGGTFPPCGKYCGKMAKTKTACLKCCVNLCPPGPNKREQCEIACDGIF